MWRENTQTYIMANSVSFLVLELTTLKLLVMSLQFSRSVVSDSLWPHKSQHARPPCPSPTPRVHPNSCPSSWWCHPVISCSVVPVSSCLQSFPASGSFPMHVSEYDQPRDQGMIARWPAHDKSVHDQPRDKCMITTWLVHAQRMLRKPHNCTHLTC